ncbi:MAG: hypothetical protein F4X87_03955 [Chloroflexi bacterium]|nr:hypothetical protein [Chloroflexota bacterium]
MAPSCRSLFGKALSDAKAPPLDARDSDKASDSVEYDARSLVLFRAGYRLAISRRLRQVGRGAMSQRLISSLSNRSSIGRDILEFAPSP